MKRNFVLFFMFFYLMTHSQKKHEFFGVLKLNGNEKTLISYNLVFELSQNKLNGYSVTDLGGENETKNSIVGTYNPKSKILEFKEADILYTKSSFSEKNFCFVNFNGKLKLDDSTTKMDGDFTGLYKNNKKCINGKINLVGADKIYKLLNKASAKIQKDKKIDAAVKNKVNPIRMLDSLKVNNLVKNQNLNVFIKSETVVLEIFDSESEDGDKINLYQNDKLILSNYEILNKKKRITVNLEYGTHTFRVEALNVGMVGFNTVTFKIIDNERVFDLKTSLKANEKAAITLMRN